MVWLEVVPLTLTACYTFTLCVLTCVCACVCALRYVGDELRDELQSHGVRSSQLTTLFRRFESVEVDTTAGATLYASTVSQSWGGGSARRSASTPRVRVTREGIQF